MQPTNLRRALGLCTSVLLLAGHSAWAAQTLEYSIRWDTQDDRYRVFMKPTTTPSPKDMSMTGQVTVLVPHAKGADRFVVDDLQIKVANTVWSNDSRVDAPVENTQVDYISFSLNMIKSDAFQWQAGKEIEVFNFRNTGKCMDGVALIDNATDPFNKPVLDGDNNSAGTNPGNQFTNLGWGDQSENNYLGNYGPKTADCSDSLDTDGDGLKNGDEKRLGTDPNKADTDGDGLSDGAEVNQYGTDPKKADTDGDGLTDGDEINKHKTDPNKADTDGDGLTDGYEVKTTKSNPLNKDTDGDGVQDNFEIGADPSKPRDTDGDGILDILDTDDDGDGILTKFEKPDANSDGNPADAQDTDGDKIPDYLDNDDNGDGIPTKDQNVDPNKDGNPADAKDTDGDGIPDYMDKNPNDGPKADADGDGLSNAEEATLGTDPNKADSDGDGLTDGAEVNTHKTDPKKADTDGDGLNDGAEVNIHKTDPKKADTDGDGLTDGDEVNKHKTDPNKTDSDGDGLNDGAEVNIHKTDPNKADSDGDGLSDGDEINKHKTDPNKADSDGDGIADGDEVKNGTNPLGIDAVKLQVKALLQGAYNATTKVMADTLRSKNLIPLVQPYNIGTIKYAGKEVVSPNLLAVTTNDAPVDWVLVEVRDTANPTTIKMRFAGLLQRDGDVMDATSGNTTLMLTGLTPGNYYIAVRHRNHLGVMTAAPVTLSASTVASVDFTKPATSTYGKDARIMANNNTVALLWAGNANIDTRVIANGPSNDTSVILGDILLAKENLSLSTNFRLNGYQATDINLDGISIFAGPSNDVNMLMGNVLLHPGNTTFSANYIINQQLP